MTALALLLATLAQPPADWPADELVLTNGSKLRGLILDDTPAGVRFRVVARRPGRPTVTLTTTLLLDEIRTKTRIADADRKMVLEKLADLDPTGAGERGRMAALTLMPADWLGRPKAARRYESDQFTLISAAPDEITRRAAVRLEQIFAAYARFLPPRPGVVARPTTVLICADRADFPAAVGPGVGVVLNPAVYDPAANRIVLGTDMRRLGDELAAAGLKNSQQFATLDAYEADVRKLYKSPAELARHLEPVAAGRKKVWAADRANDAAFDKATARAFAVLYHEAFHAYAGNFVYPPGGPGGELPRFLNEGLAQIFETAVVEAGELRVGHADKSRLDRVQALLKAGGLVPTADLVRTGRDAFLASHADQKAAADRAYLTAWAVAFHLTFERRAVGTPAFAEYLLAAAGPDPAAAFATLTDVPAGEYDKQLAAYFAKLR